MICQYVSFLTHTPLSFDQLRAAMPDSWKPDASRQKVLCHPVAGAEGFQVEIHAVDHPWLSEFTSADQQLMWGPFSRSNSLDRACKFNPIWEQSTEVARQHQGLIVCKMVSEDNSSDDVKRQILLATAFLDTILPVAKVDGISAYFCPGGEVVWPVDMFVEVVTSAQLAKVPPIDVFSNLRLAYLDERWAIFDTVGNSQFGLRDLEIYFNSEESDLNAIASQLRQWTLEQISTADALEDGQTVAGPDEDYLVRWTDDSLEPPVRDVIRLIAEDHSSMPTGLPKRLGIAES